MPHFDLRSHSIKIEDSEEGRMKADSKRDLATSSAPACDRVLANFDQPGFAIYKGRPLIDAMPTISMSCKEWDVTKLADGTTVKHPNHLSVSATNHYSSHVFERQSKAVNARVTQGRGKVQASAPAAPLRAFFSCFLGNGESSKSTSTSVDFCIQAAVLKVELNSDKVKVQNEFIQSVLSSVPEEFIFGPVPVESSLAQVDYKIKEFLAGTGYYVKWAVYLGGIAKGTIEVASSDAKHFSYAQAEQQVNATIGAMAAEAGFEGSDKRNNLQNIELQLHNLHLQGGVTPASLSRVGDFSMQGLAEWFKSLRNPTAPLVTVNITTGTPWEVRPVYHILVEALDKGTLDADVDQDELSRSVQLIHKRWRHVRAGHQVDATPAIEEIPGATNDKEVVFINDTNRAIVIKIWTPEVVFLADVTSGSTRPSDWSTLKGLISEPPGLAMMPASQWNIMPAGQRSSLKVSRSNTPVDVWHEIADDEYRQLWKGYKVSPGTTFKVTS